MKGDRFNGDGNKKSDSLPGNGAKNSGVELESATASGCPTVTRNPAHVCGREKKEIHRNVLE